MTVDTHSATQRIESLIEITESLSEIFNRENHILVEQRPGEIASLQAEKARLAAAYAQSIRDIAQNRTLVEDAEPNLLNELKSITKTFESRASHQRALLDGAGQAAEGVVRAISAEAATRQKSAAPYSPRARNENTTKHATPISIDESA